MSGESMTPAERRAAFAMVRAAAQAESMGALALALSAFGAELADAMRSPNARRTKRWRHRKRSEASHRASPDRHDVTLNETSTTRIRDAFPSPSPDPSLSPERHISDSFSVSSLSSPKQGSGLEERAGGSSEPNRWPDRIEITEAIREQCRMAGAPVPTEADAVAMLAHYRSEGRWFPDFGARLVWWQSSPQGQAARRRGLASAQPVPPELRAAYERGIAAGKGGPYALAERDVGDLAEVVRVFARKRSGEALQGAELVGFVEAAAQDFASWLVRRDEKTIGIFSSYGPRGLVRFLNEQESQAEARRVP